LRLRIASEERQQPRRHLSRGPGAFYLDGEEFTVFLDDEIYFLAVRCSLVLDLIADIKVFLEFSSGFSRL
jgi:hypothetical protein